jgi:SSS family transporter
VIYVTTQIDVTGKAFESMMGMDYTTGAILGFVIVLSYIFIGGFVAAVWSDLFQGLLMFAGLVLLPIVVWYNMDGATGVVDSLHAIDPALTNAFGTSDDVWMNVATMLGFAMIGLGFLGSPQVYVRFMSIKNEREIDKGKWVAIVFTLLTDAAAVTIGILGRILFTSSGEDPEAILGTSGEDVLSMLTEISMPDILVAVYVAIVLSAIMSTIDSLLVIASSAITRDFYQKIFRPDLKDEDLTKISRWVTLVMALLALIIALIIAQVAPDRTVFWMVIFGWSGIAASFCPVIILTLFWKGLSEKGAIAAMIAGFLCVPFFKFVVQEIDGIGPYFEKLDVLAPSFLISLLMAWLFSKLYPNKRDVEIEEEKIIDTTDLIDSDEALE